MPGPRRYNLQNESTSATQGLALVQEKCKKMNEKERTSLASVDKQTPWDAMVEDIKDFYVCRQTSLIAALSLPFQSQGRRIRGSSVLRNDFGLLSMYS